MNQPRLRKDIRALSNAERARFFFCLKMLDILPPRESNNLRVFFISYFDQDLGQQLQITPKNIHDQFIASHQTTCQHGSPYFPYYHRHLLICAEISLNYAEEVLLAGSSAVPNGIFFNHQNQWNAVFAKYQSIIATLRQQKNLGAAEPLPQLAMHYWNPIDYTQSIVIPAELTKRVPDQIDSLCFAINNHYVWNFNFQNRWFNNRSIPSDFISNGYFSQNQPRYDQNQLSILNGTLNPRSQALNFFTSAVVQNDFGSFNYTLADTVAQYNVYRNYLQFNQTGNTIDVCTLDQNQIDALFGSKKKQLHWISQTQRKQMDPTSQQNAYIYNKFLPHFQYAYALMKNNSNFMPNFVTTSSSNFQFSMQNCHNTMHNNLQLFMSDSQLSITNLLFFIYHSWIDLALQTKIRMIRTSDRNQAQLLNTTQYLNNIKRSSILDQPSGQPGNIRYADYYIYQWATPIVRDNFNDIVLSPQDYQAAFKGINFVVNGTIGIRKSDEISQFYQQNYVPQQASRYTYFNGFKNFIYDYNYQIYDYNQNGDVVLVQMQGNVVPIPSYILAISQDYQNLWDNNLTRSTNVELDQSKQIKVQSKQRSSFKIPSQRLQSLSLSNPFNQLIVQTYYDIKYLLRAIKVTLAGYGRYSSTLKSTVVPIALQLTQKGYKQLVLNKKHFKTLKKGIVFTFYPIFSKSNGAHVCPNCEPEKQIWISISEHLAEINSELFCGLMGCFNNELVYQVIKNNVTVIKQNQICDLLRLSSSKPVLKTLKLIQGAVQVNIKVTFCGKQDYKTSKIKINGFSYAVQNDKLFNIISKKKQNLNCEVQLAQVIGINQMSTHHRYVYRAIKVFITNGNEHRQFEFKIHTYHDMIRYTIDIIEREGQKGKYLDVTVKDRDFGFKQKHFALECYQV